MTFFPDSLTGAKSRCDACRQPIVDLRDQSVFAHEALVRGPVGEGALDVLRQVDDTNRYRFDQECRTRAIKGAAALGMQQHLSINFMPNAVYRPELCIRSTLEAAKAHDFPLDKLIFETLESEHIDNYRHLTHILREYRPYAL